MQLPLRLFWSATRHVDRLKAAQDLRNLNVALVAAITAQHGGETLKELQNQLNEQMGTVVRFKEVSSSKADIEALIRNTGF